MPGNGPVELVADVHVAGIHGVQAQLALGDRDIALHEVPQGEAAKTPAQLERLWRALRIGRDGIVVALGGGSTSDLVGFAAATWARGVDWVPVPTTLVGQVDAAIGGKTAIDLPAGKNLVGAFHWPARVVVDPLLLETLPEAELRNGLAEVVKTGLLAGEPLWELRRVEQVRRCAAFKAAVCLADPHDRGPRAQLNLGHTFAHALEAAAGYAAAARRGRRARPARRASPLRATTRASQSWNERSAARARSASTASGRGRRSRVTRRLRAARRGSSCSSVPGEPRWGVEVPDADVRAALDALIAD